MKVVNGCHQMLHLMTLMMRRCSLMFGGHLGHVTTVMNLIVIRKSKSASQ